MQSELNDNLQETSLTSSTQDNHQDSQYGFDQSTQQLPVQPLAGERRPEPRRSPGDSASSTSSGSDFDEALEYPLRGLSPPSWRQNRSSVDRVAEHEKALFKPPKRRTEGPAFTVVQRGQKPIYDRIAIADFPNGSLLNTTTCAVANCCRGVDSYPFPLTPCFTVRRLPCLQTISSASHNATCLEDCFFAVFPRKRGVEWAGRCFGVISGS